MLAKKEHLLCERGLFRILPLEAVFTAIQDRRRCGTELISVFQGVVGPNHALGVARGDRRKKEGEKGREDKNKVT